MKRLMTAMLATLTVTAALDEYPEKPITIGNVRSPPFSLRKMYC